MEEKVDNLVLEHLRAIRGDISRIDDELRAFRGEMTSSRLRPRSVETLQDTDHEDIIQLKIRMDRIERRLELVDDKS
jgi:hypothetical protein